MYGLYRNREGKMSRENKIHLAYFSCGDVRYDFCIETVFGSSLPPIVCRGAHVLFTFVCALWCPTHIDYMSYKRHELFVLRGHLC